jgi:hypothetical protein
MSTASEDRPGRFARLYQEVAHYEAPVLFLYALVPVVRYFLKPDISPAWTTFEFTALVVVFVVMFGSYRHVQSTCETCQEKFSLDAPEEALVKREYLRRFHLLCQPWLFVVWTGFLIGGIFPPTGWLLGGVYVFLGLRAHYARIHRPLTPWCPWCHGGRGGDDNEEELPDPVPPSQKQEKV